MVLMTVLQEIRRGPGLHRFCYPTRAWAGWLFVVALILASGSVALGWSIYGNVVGVGPRTQLVFVGLFAVFALFALCLGAWLLWRHAELILDLKRRLLTYERRRPFLPCERRRVPFSQVHGVHLRLGEGALESGVEWFAEILVTGERPILLGIAPSDNLLEPLVLRVSSLLGLPIGVDGSDEKVGSPSTSPENPIEVESALTHLQRGNQHLTKAKYPEAVREYLQHAEECPGQAADAFTKLGICYERGKNLALPKLPLPEAKGMNPSLRIAESCYRKALEVEPGHVEAALKLAALLQSSAESGRGDAALLDECIALLSEATRACPNPVALLELGDLHRKQKDHSRAYEVYAKLAETDPNDISAYRRLWSLCTATGQTEKLQEWKQRWQAIPKEMRRGS